MATLTHAQAIKLGLQIPELQKYEDLIYTKYQISNHTNHQLQGLVSFNIMLDTQTFPQRVLDLLPEELKTQIPIKTTRKQVKESKLQHRFKSIQEKQTAAV